MELLEMILCPLSAWKDIEKCINTCTKWRKIIQNLFPNYDKSKLSFENSKMQIVNSKNCLCTRNLILQISPNVLVAIQT